MILQTFRSEASAKAPGNKSRSREAVLGPEVAEPFWKAKASLFLQDKAESSPFHISVHLFKCLLNGEWSDMTCALAGVLWTFMDADLLASKWIMQCSDAFESKGLVLVVSILL